jgi:twitching motility protein PilI
MAQSSASAFALLAALDQRGRQQAAVLPASEEVRQEWAGIGFRLGGRRFVAPMDEVTEILTCPPLSQVPHTKSWVRGIANVRGNLLPVMDLGGFLGRHSALITRFTRVVVIQQSGVHAGLLVDEVLGMRHFYDEERVAVPEDLDESLAPFVTGAFERDSGSWLLFSMRVLAGHPQFLKVAS